MDKLCFGVDIGGTSVKLGLFTDKGSLVDKWEIPTRTEDKGSFILSDVVASIKEKITEKNLDKKQLVGIGIGVPGPVTEDGTVINCVNLGWGVFNVVDEMKKYTDLPVKVGNDANVAALGEMWEGGGKGYQNMIMVTLGTGVGGGVILNGEILCGSKGAAGEIGHLTVCYEEPDACNCGKHGCLEQYASATGVVKEAKRMLSRTDEPSVLRDVENITAKAIFDAAKDGDTLAVKLVEQLGRYLGLALSHIAAVVDPQVFVIGGGVSKAGSILIDSVKEHYESNVMFALKNKEFRLAELENDAGIFGSAKLILGK